jgi:hypothetical protein
VVQLVACAISRYSRINRQWIVGAQEFSQRRFYGVASAAAAIDEEGAVRTRNPVRELSGGQHR